MLNFYQNSRVTTDFLTNYIEFISVNVFQIKNPILGILKQADINELDFKQFLPFKRVTALYFYLSALLKSPFL